MNCNSVLTDQDFGRYEKQIRLPEVGIHGQECLKGSSVVVVGAGALGCTVLQHLAASGVGTIGIVDNDWVDESNLHSQVLYTAKDIEKPKPLAAKEKLSLINPEIKIRMNYIRIDRETAFRILKDYDIVVDCTDNFATRYLLNDACVILKKPLVYGSIERFSGQVMVLNYKSGPTLRCLYPSPAHLLETPSGSESGIIGPIAGIIGSMQAGEVIKIILDRDDVLSGRVYILDSLSFTSNVVLFNKNLENLNIKTLGNYDELPEAATQAIREISKDELKNMFVSWPGLTLIDLSNKYVKSKLEFDSIPIPYYEINKKIGFILGRNPVVFYCNNGIQSTKVISYFQAIHKKENLFNLVL